MFIPQIGTRLKYRPTGTIFKVKNITNQFVVLYSLDGLSQAMVETNGFVLPFEFEELTQLEPTQEDAARNI